MNVRQVGAGLVVAGVALAVVGALAWAGWLSWFGRLPGDVHVERPGFRIEAPFVSMLIVSIVLSLAVALVRRLF
ncbi:MAG: hypothetical protein AMXMBFR36_13100 [Acidobacteriota bacterium]